MIKEIRIKSEDPLKEKKTFTRKKTAVSAIKAASVTLQDPAARARGKYCQFAKFKGSPTTKASTCIKVYL